MGLGDNLKKWAQSKATELLTADSGTRFGRRVLGRRGRGHARRRTSASRWCARRSPGSGKLADRAGGVAGRARGGRRPGPSRRDRCAAALARSSLTLTGTVNGVVVRVGCLTRGPTSRPASPDPTDPYADQPLVWFELFATEGARRSSAGRHLTHWSVPAARLPRRRPLRPHGDRPGSGGGRRRAGLPRVGAWSSPTRTSAVLLPPGRGPVIGDASRARRCSRPRSR